ncbi:MAG TPA: hypothetical protein VGH20_16790 [Myxococcales bacterium]
MKSLVAAVIAGLALAAGPARASSTVQLTKGGSSSPQTSVIGGASIADNEIDQAFADEDDDDLVLFGSGADNGDPDAAPNSVRALVNRSIATASGHGRDGRDSRRAVANPQLAQSFDGVNFFDQRFSNNGNQFSVEPPDQGLCAGNGFIVESANDVMKIFDTTGTLVVGPVDLNTFYGYAPAINRAANPLTFGPSITDPSCYYDQALKRFFHVVLTLDRANPLTQGLSGANHLDIAVSDTANPTGTWTIFHLAVQNDGSAGTPNHGCVQGPRNGPFTPGPCLGDYPHIGADENGIFLTTNEFDLAGPFFHGAQIYAISKAALAAGAANPNAVLFNTGDDADSPVVGFTVWPAQSADASFSGKGHGTEFLLSSDAVFSDDGTSTNVVVWSLTNTRSLNSTPAIALSTSNVTVDQYGVPPRSNQKVGANLPLRDCIADPVCRVQIGATATRNDPESPLDSNDSRMQQVALAKNLLWGALDTAVTVNGAVKAGIAFFVIDPAKGTVSTQGTIAVANNNVTYPAIAVTREGRGVMAFTLVGTDHFPSAGFVGLDSRAGAGALHVAAEGLGPQDGFSGYQPFSARPRWGDYGAAAADGSSVWIASEYIGQTCTFTEYKAAPLGTCSNTRAPLGNWDTRISRVTPGDNDD